MMETELFEQNQEVLSGALVFRGTRVPVDVLFDSLLGGSNLSEILEDFPTIGRERAEAAIRHAKRLLHDEAA